LDGSAAGPGSPAPNRLSLRFLKASRRQMALESFTGRGFRAAADRSVRGRASSIINRHSRAMPQVSDHQTMSQGSSW